MLQCLGSRGAAGSPAASHLAWASRDVPGRTFSPASGWAAGLDSVLSCAGRVREKILSSKGSAQTGAGGTKFLPVSGIG